MAHNEVYKWFISYFPAYSEENLDAWFPNGKNSIRVRHKSGREYVFTFQNPSVWSFETLKSFMERGAN